MIFVEGKDVDGRFFARERVEVKFEGGGQVAKEERCVYGPRTWAVLQWALALWSGINIVGAFPYFGQALDAELNRFLPFILAGVVHPSICILSLVPPPT